jgi:hypothetical protein
MKPIFDLQELKLKAVLNAVAQQRFEGLEPSEAFIEDLKQLALGQITDETLIHNIRLRYL